MAKYESYAKCNELLELIPYSEDWIHLCCKKGELKPKDNKVTVHKPMNEDLNSNHISESYVPKLKELSQAEKDLRRE